MFRTMMKSKIHRATVTEANLNYVGSITIDQDILDAVDILENEKVQIVNNNNGARLETYVISGARGSGVICLNGAAARLVQPGDTVIIISYVSMSDADAKSHVPTVALMDNDNKIVEMLSEKHGTIV
ncbi:L-aspartate 1-decarboxylase [Tumebacillus sp. BK434]|uniref:aspartate 1-decarboxylase n=1 Tax=Tumebacillus sp. BK434 TaxID=2512169 RepID=UPI00105371D4|nr:aspartate 1-decarboxylase [Tumebacillus sp. BK434]TCP59286.1 L-aspartate 1-decarboxylase [Tumebacillus sp. BK434]